LNAPRRTISVLAVTNTLAAVVSENRKLKDSTRCLLDRLTDSYNRPSRATARISRVEAGSNTSTVALRVVGDVESERVKYGHESHGTRTRERLL
jgi:hypothetical protein